MNTSTYRYSILAAAIAASISAPTQAQEEAEAQQEEAQAAVERVQITGSRIARDPNLVSSSPVESLGEEEFDLSGDLSVADVVNDIPALFSSTTAEGSNDTGVFATGTNVLSLRGLGSNRTLVLVNGRRHVGGVAGSSAVDVGSIPTSLVKRVEVLTGGASAVYGADAVTGVVNFILEDEYEGFEFDAQVGAADEGDAQRYKISSTYGESFDGGRGNIAVNVEYSKDEGLRAGERDGGVFIGSGRDWVNPAKRFQQGTINPSSMPNFAQFFHPDNDRSTYGLAIPGSADDFISQYEAAFGSAPTLTQAERDLIQQAADAPQRAILPGRTFPFTSGYGYIIPGNPYTFAGFDQNTPIDLNNNGTPDCLDSFTGYFSSFAPGAFGAIGGCWNVTEDGNYRPIQDGLVANGFQGFGGDSFNTIQQQQSYLIPPSDKLAVNLLSSYDLTDDLVLKAELKFVDQSTENTTQPNSFWDLVFGAADNPYLPEFIQPIADQTGGVAITVDPIGIGPGGSEHDRETIRGVLSLDGYLDNGWNYGVSATWGQFKRETALKNAVIVDRFFAATDAVTDPATGQPACRSEVDPDAPAMTTPFNIPDYEAGYFTFTPGDGSCVPLNIWAGKAGITQEAVDWVTRTENDSIKLTQTVISAFLSGDTYDYFELPAGPISFAVGAEYREEESEARFDPWQRGVLPQGSPYGAGTNISDVSSNNKLTFRPATIVRNETGSYDVYDVFAEASIPLLADAFLAYDLTLDLAARYSDYSTVGETTTWRANLLWSPVYDVNIRASYSEAVRAPNITELFGPEVGTTFRPADPCDAAQISALRDEGLTQLADNTQANCVADFNSIGLDPFDGDGNYTFSDPLSAAFGGVTGGNPDLQEETAETLTIGLVYTPEAFEGFSFTADYWDISLEDAINAVSGQNIADGCYQGQSLNQQFCSLLTRNDDPNSIFFGGFNFMKSTSINFAKRETSGYDFSVGYDFDYEEHRFTSKISGTYVEELNDFTNPLNLEEVDPELGEIRRPELAGNIYLSWMWGDLKVNWQSNYQDEQLLQFAEVETYQALYGETIMQDATWSHDLNASYQLDDSVQIYGGVNNVTDEEPFITNYAYPVSARGRYVFLGVNYKMQ